MNFERTHTEARVTESRKTPLGLEVDMNDNGRIFTVRAGDPEGKLIVCRSLTQGGIDADTLPPATLRMIRKALQELSEHA